MPTYLEEFAFFADQIVDRRARPEVLLGAGDSAEDVGRRVGEVPDAMPRRELAEQSH